MPIVKNIGNNTLEKQYIASDKILEDIQIVDNRRKNITAGFVTFNGYTDNGDGSITLPNNTVRLHGDSEGASMINEYTVYSATLSLNDGLNWVYADYNGGYPIYKVTQNEADINYINNTPYILVYKTGNTLKIFEFPLLANALTTKLYKTKIATDRFEIVNGFDFTEVNDRYIKVGSGILYDGIEKIILNTIDTSTGNYLITYYHQSGNWVNNTTNQQFDNTQYDNGTDLATLNDGEYGIHWVYRDLKANNIYLIYGNQGYTKLIDALSAQPNDYSYLPKAIQKTSFLIGKIVFVKNGTNAIDFISYLKKEPIIQSQAFRSYIGDVIFEENVQFDSNVNDGDLVYRGTDGIYYQAIADGTNKAKVVGIADKTSNRLLIFGIIQTNTSFDAGTDLYLSSTNAGQISDQVSDVKIGLALGNGKVLLGTVGGGGSIGDVTFEDIEYTTLLNTNPFKNLYYDKFIKNDLTVVQGEVTFDIAHNRYQISNTATTPAILQTAALINDGNTYYRFMIHVDSDVVPTVEYSTDGGSTWVSAELDNTILVSSGFTNLILKFTFNSDGNFNSYGVLYEYDFNEYTTDTRMLEVMTLTQDYASGSKIQLPNNAVYTNNGKSLEVYLNRVRLIPNVDYIEVDNRTVQFNVDLKTNDVIVFTEKYGYVDTSVENYNRLNYEHNDIGQHIFTDLSTGKKYRLAVNNGNIVLIEQ